MPILQIPPDAKRLELSNSIIWFEDDILYSRPKPGPFVHQSREVMLEDVQKFKAFTGGKKVCMIVEGHPNSESPAKEDRDFIAEQLTDITKAMAVMTPSAVSRMVANLFFLFKPPAYPMKLFLDVSDAKAWLQTCLAKRPSNPVL
jgi:hypothetical protein